jgi:hypothetical protein
VGRFRKNAGRLGTPIVATETQKQFVMPGLSRYPPCRASKTGVRGTVAPAQGRRDDAMDDPQALIRTLASLVRFMEAVRALL